MKTQITFNLRGKPMVHSFGRPTTMRYAMDCFRRSITSPASDITNFQVLHPATAVEADQWEKDHYRPPVGPRWN